MRGVTFCLRDSHGTAHIKLAIPTPSRKHAYSYILKILLPKNENFQIKILIFFMFLLKTYSLEPHRRGSSNEYPQSMF